jgi:hypothetical protein
MMELRERGGDGQTMIETAIEKMPSFSQEIQQNNVLSKRIMALRQKDQLTT